MVDIKLARIPFKEGAAKLRGKTPEGTKAYTDLLHEAHDKAFVIAGVTNVNLLTDAKNLLADAMESGISFEQWQREFKKTIEGRWLPTTKTGEPNTGWRARVIYETNMKTAYAAERHKLLQEIKKLKPFWRYRIGNSKKHRPDHESWNGLVLSADDPWWKTHFPPNGWGCNCYIEALDEIDMRELGRSAPDTAPPDNPRRVQYGDRIIEVPQGIDPGWAYTPGANDTESVLRTLEKADPEIAEKAWDDIKPYLREQLDKEQDGKPDRETPPATEMMNTGEVKPETPEKLKEKIAEKPKIADKPEHEVFYEKALEEVLEKIECPVPIELGDLYELDMIEYDKRPWVTYKREERSWYEDAGGICLSLSNTPDGKDEPVHISVSEKFVKQWHEKGVDEWWGTDGYYNYKNLTAEQQVKIVIIHEIAHSMQKDRFTANYLRKGGHTGEHRRLMYKLLSEFFPDLSKYMRVMEKKKR